jgi:site-specific DNA recombinase
VICLTKQQTQDTIRHTRRAIIYCRVSTDKQEQDGESLEYQEEKGRRYAELHDMDVIMVLSEAKSGFIHYSFREKLTLARQMIREGLADVIIVWDLRRFSRNFVHSAMIFEEIESAGGEVISVSENIDNSLTGKLIRSILAWSAESEREKIVEYANRHWQKRHELNLPMATTTPSYGWKWGDKDKTYFVLNKEEAAVRRSIFEMFVEMDMSIRQIGHKLTIDGIKTPREARKELESEEEDAIEDGVPELEPEEEEGAEDGVPKLIPWTTGTIHMYLQDVANIGTLVICKKKRILQPDGTIKYITHPEQKIIPGAMPPIVSPEMFERAQRKLATNRETKSHPPRNPEDYLLIGHVYCALCGHRMHPIAEKGLPMYRCNKHMSVYDPNPSQCDPHVLRVKMSVIDPVVWEDCCRVFERLDNIQNVIRASIDQFVENMLENTQGRALITELEEQIAYARQERDKHPEGSYYYKLISQDIREKEESLQRCEEEFARSRDRMKLSGSFQKSITNFLDFLNTMKGRYHEASFKEKRNALNVLGVMVRVHPDAEETPPLPSVETDKEWLSVSDASMLTGIHRNSLMLHVRSCKLKSQKMVTPHIVIHRDEIVRFLQERKQKTVDLSQEEEEWFTVHKLVVVLKVTTWRIIHQAIEQGELQAGTKDVMHSYIHRDELNRFLRESPIRLRSLSETIAPRIDVIYSPLFTDVQVSEDAQQVVNVVHNAGLAKLVARLKPVIVVKG